MSARVLVVDDIPTNVKLLEAKLASEYFDVITAFDGHSALERVESDSPDIILLDVMMPGIDGFEVCRRLKGNPRTRHIPVVMVTALSETADRVRGLEAGADDFLTKPVNDVALFARIRSLVRLKMTMDEWWRREETCDRFGVLEGAESRGEDDAIGARVHVIEENELLCEKIAKALARDDIRITAQPGRSDTIELARNDQVDLIIVGTTPSDEDAESLRVCAQLRAQEDVRQVPILLVVEGDDMATLAKGLELGVNDYIMKPIDPNELLARARTQIRRKRYQKRLRENYERSISLALIDSLTSVYNHRYADAHLGTMIERMEAGGKPLGLLMIDIDFFKSVNDDYGHMVGDEVLCEVANRICQCVRSFDMVARLGGEEFIVVLPDATEGIVATVGERLRGMIAAVPFPVSATARHIKVTVSVGATLAIRGADTPESLLRRADEAMYRAKREGRNRLVTDLGPEGQEIAESAIAQMG